MLQRFKVASNVIVRCTSTSAPLRCPEDQTPPVSLKEQWLQRKNAIFDAEKERQRGSIGRVEKITVKYFSPTDEVHLRMNKHISTPYDATRHISEEIHKTAAVAMVNGIAWDMNKPLIEDCELKILTMKMPKESTAVNLSFWRTCSVMLGATIESAFKDDVQTYLHSFPWPNIKSGSFVYDTVLDLPDWKPTVAELRSLSAKFMKYSYAELPLERLEVSEEIALDIFKENPFKSKQIPDIAKANDDKVTLYRIGKHIDISKGPLVSNTGIIGRCTVASVHKLESEETDNLYRFQAVALPAGIVLNHFAFGILEERARELNQTMWMPHREPDFLEGDKVAASV